jgi:GTP cyclohydrolase III
MRKVRFLLSLLILLTLSVACGTFEQTVYKGMYISGTTYDASMKTVASLQAQGKITQDQRAAINQIANVFYVAYYSAVDAFEIYKKTGSVESKQKLITAIHEASLKWSMVSEYVNRLIPGAIPAQLKELEEVK